MASKPSTPSSAEGAALTASNTVKSSAAAGVTTAPSQFDEAFASALQESVGVNQSPPSLPGGFGKQSAKELTSSLHNPAPPDPKAVASTPNVTNVNASLPVEVTNRAVPDALSAIGAKAPVNISRLAANTGASSTIISTDGEAKADKAKKSQSVPSQDSTDTAAMNYALAVPVPVVVPTPAANNKNSSSKSSDNAAPAQIVLPGHPVPTAQNATVAPPTMVSGPKDTEVFSMNLTPKALPVQSPATGTAVAPAPNSAGNKPEATVPTVPPLTAVGATVAPVEDGQKDMSRESIQPNKTANSPATNNSSAAPSSLGQSSAVDREGKQGEKEEPISPKSGTSDAGGSEQEPASFGPVPTSFAKETKGTGNASDVNPTFQAADISDNAPAGGSAKEVAIRLQSQSGESINVKLVDQGGQVQVTVRSSDPEAASALRQDLSSLTSSLDKAGWKPEVTVASGNSFEPVNQARQTDRNNQDSQGNKQPEWQQETPKKRQSVSDIWDELLTNQTV